MSALNAIDFRKSYQITDADGCFNKAVQMLYVMYAMKMKKVNRDTKKSKENRLRRIRDWKRRKRMTERETAVKLQRLAAADR